MRLPKINIAHIAANQQHAPIFSELIELLTECVQRLGAEVQHTINGIRDRHLNILVGSMVFLEPGAFVANHPARPPYIVFQSEAFDARHGFIPRHPAYLELLRGANQIWDYSPVNMPFLRELGCTNVHYIPLGHSNSLERIAPASVRDIDVLFYGAMSPRRIHPLNELIRRGHRVHHLFGSYGAMRDSMIARSRIVLNVHQFETSQLEQVRLSYLLNNRSFVVSEVAQESKLYGDGVVFCGYADLANCCEFYVNEGMEAERNRIAQIGYEVLKSIPCVQSIRTVLDRFTDSRPHLS